MELTELAIKLAEHDHEGASFETLVIEGEQPVLQVIVDKFDELPIYLTFTEEQIICICYLFKKDEVKSSEVAGLNETLLKLNVPVPLSSFAIVDDQYTIFGALSTSSSFDDVAHELVTLADNAADALESVEAYLS